MVLDAHIHMFKPFKTGDGVLLAKSMAEAGVDGGLILSRDPSGILSHMEPEPFDARLNDLLAICEENENFYPAFWIDPIAPDAVSQAERASKYVDAFKIVCGTYAPSDSRAMETYRVIAAQNKPILFHSGILWDGRVSSQFNMPNAFECLLEVSGLRFALAHVSWPWCDECIAVLGKFMNALALNPELSVEMFVDITPGTPVRWRREVFDKLFCGDYDVLHSVLFGTDCGTVGYNVEWTRAWQERDIGILSDLGVKPLDDFKRHIYGENLLRFLGKTETAPERKLPQIAVI